MSFYLPQFLPPLSAFAVGDLVICACCLYGAPDEARLLLQQTKPASRADQCLLLDQRMLDSCAGSPALQPLLV